MPGKVIADSAALVAFLSRDDQYHDWIAAQPESLPAPWLNERLSGYWNQAQ